MPDFSKLSLQQMLELNAQLCEAIRIRRSHECAEAVGNFCVGDRVHFAGTTKIAPFDATVEKVLRVNVDVVTDSGRRWRIPANRLERVFNHQNAEVLKLIA